jgi:hypothetical protein
MYVCIYIYTYIYTYVCVSVCITIVERTGFHLRILPLPVVFACCIFVFFVYYYRATDGISSPHFAAAWCIFVF